MFLSEGFNKAENHGAKSVRVRVTVARVDLELCLCVGDVQGPFVGRSSLAPPHEFEFDALFRFRVTLRPVGLALKLERHRFGRVQYHPFLAECEGDVAPVVELVG